MTVKIPESHRDLLVGPVNVVLTTLMPDGQPQTTPVWCNLDGNDILINSMKQFRKQENMRLNPKVTLLAYRLKQPFGAQKRFYGDIYPEEQQEKETRVIVKIKPKKITTDAIFS